MKCLHCGGELEMDLCRHCDAENLPGSTFCRQCGETMATELPPDLANRVLCPDGACIGILNEQGECSVCGLAYRDVLEREQTHG